jgi:hypothetical protein
VVSLIADALILIIQLSNEQLFKLVDGEENEISILEKFILYSEILVVKLNDNDDADPIPTISNGKFNPGSLLIVN